MAGDFGRQSAGQLAVDLLHGFGNAKVETLAAQRRQPGEQGLADQLVRELGADVVAGGGRRHQAGALGLIKGVQESVFAKVAADRREQPKVEEVTDDGGLQQGLPGVLAQALEPPSDDQPDGFWHIQFGDVEVGSPPSAGIEDQPSAAGGVAPPSASSIRPTSASGRRLIGRRLARWRRTRPSRVRASGRERSSSTSR